MIVDFNGQVFIIYISSNLQLFHREANMIQLGALISREPMMCSILVCLWKPARRRTFREMAHLPFFNRKNIFNLFLTHLVAVPIICLGLHVLYDCSSIGISPITSPVLESLQSSKSLSDLTCRVGLYHPVIFVNCIIFFFVCVVFWIISLYQESTWLIGESKGSIVFSPGFS